MIMPARAMVPSSETKPKGWLKASRNSATPIMPSGAVSMTSANFEKLCSCSIRNSTIRKAMTGIILKIEPWLRALSSLSPPTSMR